jgi:sugar phosphate isomerase/epimerase
MVTMDRLAFIQSAVAAGASMATASTLAAAAYPPHGAPRHTRFRLRYAPHFGMFREHAGEDLVAQLEFMAAEGFTALEDNGMRGRDVATQERIGTTLERLGMRMGVFVAHTISWNEATITTARDDARAAFLAEIRDSVDVARRVNATWMTVVPGHVDRRLCRDKIASLIAKLMNRPAP